MASTKSKPKPRVAVWAGLAASAVTAAGYGALASKQGLGPVKNLTDAANRAGQLVDLRKAAMVAIPAVIGAAVSVGADKVGINRVLAKARSPVRA